MVVPKRGLAEAGYPHRESVFHRLLIECGLNIAGICHAVLLHVGENFVDGRLGRIE
jgi:hypothetical protein